MTTLCIPHPAISACAEKETGGEQRKFEATTAVCVSSEDGRHTHTEGTTALQAAPHSLMKNIHSCCSALNTISWKI